MKFVFLLMAVAGGEAAAQDAKPDQVGRIIVVGNTDTPDWVILGQIDLRPGQVLQYPKLEAARIALPRCGLFDPGDPPSVEVLANEIDSQFKDVFVRVTERPWNWLLFAAVDGTLALVTLDARLMAETVGRVRRIVDPTFRTGG